MNVNSRIGRKNWKQLAAAAVLSVGLIGVTAASPALANDGLGGGRALSLCSTTNYTDVAATALGITAPELRAALVGGKTVAQIASERSVDIATVTTALRSARQADLAAAQSAGLITQEQYDALIARLDTVGDRQERSGNYSAGLKVAATNAANVQVEVVAAQALGISCADLVKEVVAGKTVSQIATERNVTLETVTNAIVAAYRTALDQDVSEGLITRIAADGRLAQITARVTAQIDRGFGFGIGRDKIGGKGKGGRGDKAATPAVTPEATTTAPAVAPTFSS